MEFCFNLDAVLAFEKLGRERLCKIWAKGRSGQITGSTFWSLSAGHAFMAYLVREMWKAQSSCQNAARNVNTLLPKGPCLRRIQVLNKWRYRPRIWLRRDLKDLHDLKTQKHPKSSRRVKQSLRVKSDTFMRQQSTTF